MKDFLIPAINTVKEAGEKAKIIFGHSVVERLKDNDDLATDADLLVEQFIFDSIHKQFPEHGFDSEERSVYQPEAEHIWILDPIDGTKYFQNNIPLYSISLALERNKQGILGIVYFPETNDFFYASLEGAKGAIKNELPICCSNEKSIEDLSIIMEIPNRNDIETKIDAANLVMLSLQKKVKRIRIIGVGSIGLCWCAMGGFDVYLNLNVSRKSYDFAAGRVILEQSGGYYLENEQMIIAGRKENVTTVLNSLLRNL